MKKEYIESTHVTAFLKAMNDEEDILCETIDGEECRIDKIHCEPSIAGSVRARIDYTITGSQKQCLNKLPERLRLYRRIFEDGDYVRQQCGDILICAGITDNYRYLYHAALTKDNELDFPDEFYMYGAVMAGDRLCTAEEKKALDDAMRREGKIFNEQEKKVEDYPTPMEGGRWKEEGGTKFIAVHTDGKIEVPSSLTLADLHDVVKKCMNIIWGVESTGPCTA